MKNVTLVLTDSMVEDLSSLNVTAQDLFNSALKDRLYRRERSAAKYAEAKKERELIAKLREENPELFRQAFEKAGLR